MVSVPLGYSAYLRNIAKTAEVALVNRYFEPDPTNRREKAKLVSRPGTSLLTTFLPDTVGGGIRGLYSKLGLFNDALFAVSGGNFYRYDTAGTTEHIQGTIRGTGRPSVTWQQGPGYERLFIADSQLLNYYEGGSHATGTMTLTGTIDGTDIIEIGGTYYGWSATVNAGSPDGSIGAPFMALLDADPVKSMSNMLNFIGTPGTNFSAVLAGANTQVSASYAGGPPATSMTLTARSDLADGNAITTTAGAHTAFGAATLTGGGFQTIYGVAVPNGDAISCVATLKNFILCAVSDSNKFYYIRPGATTIDALDFATKESAPDRIVDMVAVGDVIHILGSGSQETWYATGDNANPLAPLEGRTINRGVMPGTAVVLEDSVILVGSDGIVYNIGGSAGDFTGVIGRISDHGIEERIRTQLRREAGLPP